MSAMSTLPEFTHSPSCSCLLPRALRCQDATCSHPVTTRRAAHSVKRRQQQPARCDDRMGAPQPDRDPSIRFEPPKQKANKNFNPFKNVKKEVGSNVFGTYCMAAQGIASAVASCSPEALCFSLSGTEFTIAAVAA